jgi:hypothetical protein
MRSRGPIQQPDRTLGEETVKPSIRTLARHTKFGRDMSGSATSDQNSIN